MTTNYVNLSYVYSVIISTDVYRIDRLLTTIATIIYSPIAATTIRKSISL